MKYKKHITQLLRRNTRNICNLTCLKSIWLSNSCVVGLSKETESKATWWPKETVFIWPSTSISYSPSPIRFPALMCVHAKRAKLIYGSLFWITLKFKLIWSNKDSSGFYGKRISEKVTNFKECKAISCTWIRDRSWKVKTVLPELTVRRGHWASADHGYVPSLKPAFCAFNPSCIGKAHWSSPSTALVMLFSWTLFTKFWFPSAEMKCGCQHSIQTENRQPCLFPTTVEGEETKLTAPFTLSLLQVSSPQSTAARSQLIHPHWLQTTLQSCPTQIQDHLKPLTAWRLTSDMQLSTFFPF